jgi:hypothetical protein
MPRATLRRPKEPIFGIPSKVKLSKNYRVLGDISLISKINKGSKQRMELGHD